MTVSLKPGARLDLPAARRRREDETARPNGAAKKAPAPILKAATMGARSVSWLWHPYIPASQISLLGAPGGGGKGLNATEYASCITTGRPWPCGNEAAPLGHVLWCEAEDPLPEVVIPRLMAAGADRERVDIASREAFGGLADLRGFIKANGTRLIVMSPVVSFLSGLAEINAELGVREVLEQLQAAIEGTGCAVLGLAHTNKKADLRAVERLLGSVAFTNFVRSVLLVSRDREDPEWFRLVHAKHNLSPKGDDLLYRPHHVGEDPRDQFVRLDWRRPENGNVDADALFDRPKGSNGSGGRQTAREWLRDYLSENGETMREDAVIAGAQAGHTEAALEKAVMRDHRLQSRREAFPNQAWWSVV